MRTLLLKIRILLTPRDKWTLVRVTLLMAVSALLEIVGIGLLLPVVAVFVRPELLTQNHYLKVFHQLFPFSDPVSFTVFCCVLMAGVYCLKNLFALYVIRRQAAFIFRKQAELSTRLYGNYLTAPYRFFQEGSVAELNANISRVSSVCTCIFMPFMSFMTDLFVVLLLSAVLFFFMPLISVGSVCFILVVAGGVYFLMRKMNGRFGRAYAESDNRAAGLRLNGLNGIKDIKAAHAERFFISEYSDGIHAVSNYSKKLFILGQVPRLTLETAAIFLALGIFIIMTVAGQPTGTILLTFSLLIAALSRMLPACSRMHYNLTQMRQYLWVFELVFRDINGLKSEELIRGDSPPVHFDETLEVRNLTFGYGKQVLFRDFSIAIKALESVALTGVTGSGKTTFADLLLGLQKPQSGGIYADGRNIEENLGSWRALTAYVPQSIFLLDGSLLENVGFGLPLSEIEEESVWNALDMAQLKEFAASLPDGLNTRIGENGIKLSGGQRQRLGIARALYRKPKLLILDEATSGLDVETEAAFVDALEHLRGKLTTVIIAHRLSTVERCDRKIKLA